MFFHFIFTWWEIAVRKSFVIILHERETCSECLSVSFKQCTVIKLFIDEVFPLIEIEIHHQMQVIYGGRQEYCMSLDQKNKDR